MRLKRKEVFCSGIVLFLIASCSNIDKKNVETPAEQVKTAEQLQQEKMTNEEWSATRRKAWEASRKAQKQHHPSKIIGSSHISKENAESSKHYYLYGAEHLNLENYYFDFPVIYNKVVKKWIDYFLKRGRDFFARYSQRAGRYAPLMGKILEDHGLPRDLIFLAMAESGFQNKAKSWAKAVGPWQFMPYTGKNYGLKIDWYIDERRDPIKATIAAARYLDKLYGDFGSWELAAAGYNAGEGKVSRAIKRYKTDDFWRIRRGRYLRSETKNYVPKIMALAIIGKNLKSFGFDGIQFYDPLDFEEIDVGPLTDIYKVAQSIGVDVEEIQYLNPEIQRWTTPPGSKSYKLRVPVGKKVTWQDCCEKDGEDFVASDFMLYKVRKKSTRMSNVARKFRLRKKHSKVLLSLNQGKKLNSRLKRGDVVMLPFRMGQNTRANMYADLYEKPRRSVVRRRQYRKRIKRALRRGRKISNPKRYYTVKKGDSLWAVSRKTGTSLDTIIASNYRLIRQRQIRAGDRLVVK